MSGDFSADQKRYLEGFVSGVQAVRGAGGLLGKHFHSHKNEYYDLHFEQA